MPVVPQRTVSLAIKTTGSGHKVSYTYVSPKSNKHHDGVAQCDLIVNDPVYCLFFLDYASSAAGWTIEKITAANGSPLIPSELGPQNLSVVTDYTFTAPSPTFNFYICYSNANGDGFCEDPQEGNGPP